MTCQLAHSFAVKHLTHEICNALKTLVSVERFTLKCLLFTVPYKKVVYMCFEIFYVNLGYRNN